MVPVWREFLFDEYIDAARLYYHGVRFLVLEASYLPSLLPLKKIVQPPGNLYILNQGGEGACTGFGLAAVINMQNQLRGRHYPVSARMLWLLTMEVWSSKKKGADSALA